MVSMLMVIVGSMLLLCWTMMFLQAHMPYCDAGEFSLDLAVFIFFTLIRVGPSGSQYRINDDPKMSLHVAFKFADI